MVLLKSLPLCSSELLSQRSDLTIDILLLVDGFLLVLHLSLHFLLFFLESLDLQRLLLVKRIKVLNDMVGLG